MKTKLFNLLGVAAIVATMAIAGCSEDDDIDFNFVGSWVNERGDAFFFKGTKGFETDGLLYYLNYDPYYPIFYVYEINIKRDSIFLAPSHDSNMNSWRWYPIDLGDSEFTLYGFNDKDKDVYKRVKQ